MADVRERLTAQGVEAQPTTPAEFTRLLAADVERWAKVVQRAGIKAE
jgi:tripartite-type tricarboxylate transporter receptor subunit TctC